MNDLAQNEEQLLALVHQHGSLGPKQAADALGWTKEQVAQAKEGLKAKGLISTGKGGSMQVASGPKANRPVGQEAVRPKAGNLHTAGPIQPVTKDLEGTCPKAHRPIGQEASKSNGQRTAGWMLENADRADQLTAFRFTRGCLTAVAFNRCANLPDR